MKTSKPRPRNPGGTTTRIGKKVDRAWIVVERAINCGWFKFTSPEGKEQLLATIRIALDTEVRAGGPYLDKTYSVGAPLKKKTVTTSITHGEAAQDAIDRDLAFVEMDGDDWT